MNIVWLAENPVWAVCLLGFLCMGLAVVGIVPAFIARARVRRRLAHPHGAGGSVEPRANRIVAALQRRSLFQEDAKAGVLRQRLTGAGYDQPDAFVVYTLLRVLLALGLPGLFFAAHFTSSASLSLPRLYAIGAGLALLGLYLPHAWVNRRAARRRQDMLNGLPDALDLMLVCVEAGLGLDAAFQRVGQELAQARPALARQLAAVTLELRAGRSREEALRRMGERSGVPELRSFVMLLAQSERLGTSISQTLRTYAAEMRERRRLRAEEKAHRLPVLLSLPLVACLLPAMLGVLMLPAAIRVMRDLLPALAR